MSRLVTEDVPDRLEGWKALCGYEPHWEYQTTRIPNAMRVELLVHTELIDLRRIERGCSGCGRDHDEWIETSPASARAVVEQWAEWMQQSNPYTHEGLLSSHIVREIFEHKWSKVPLTGVKMLALMWDDQAAVPAASPPWPPVVLNNRLRRRTVASIDCLDPDAPRVYQPSLPIAATDSTNVSEDSDSSSTGWSCSPRQVKLYPCANDSNVSIREMRSSAAPLKITWSGLIALWSFILRRLR